jgi:hypothetical protein
MTDQEKLVEKLSQLYDDYRSARLLQKYYGDRLAKYVHLTLAFDIAQAVGTSTAVGGWLVWQAGFGPGLWGIIAGIAAVVALVRPFLDLTSKVQRYSLLLAGLTDYYTDLERLVSKVSTTGEYNITIDKAHQEANRRCEKIIQLQDPLPARSRLARYQDEVNEEIPVDSLWMPPALEG